MSASSRISRPRASCPPVSGIPVIGERVAQPARPFKCHRKTERRPDGTHRVPRLIREHQSAEIVLRSLSNRPRANFPSPRRETPLPGERCPGSRVSLQQLPDDVRLFLLLVEDARAGASPTVSPVLPRRRGTPGKPERLDVHGERFLSSPILRRRRQRGAGVARPLRSASP